jgi:4-amino-4-deoxy-L-arabinose transferase-like glycosyltransferase
MKQNPATKEAKSQADKKPYSDFTSPSKSPLWFVTSFVLLLASLISLIYVYLKGSKPRPRQGNSNAAQPPESKQLTRNTIKDQPVVKAPVDNIEPPVTKDTPLKIIPPASDRMNYRNVLGAIVPSFQSIFAWLKENRTFTGLIALVIGVTGQFVVWSNQLLIGAILIGIAVLLFVIIFRTQAVSDSKLTTDPWIQQSFNPEWTLWGGITLGLAVLFAGLAFWLFGISIPAIYPWLLHLGSIGLFILASFWMNKSGPTENQRNKKATWTWSEIGIFVAILTTAAFMRLYRLGQMPFGLWYDEADDGLNALRILNEPGYLPVFEGSTALPTHYLYLIALFFRILGVFTFSLRSVSVVVGLATVVAAFFVGSELFNRKLGLVLAFFLAVSRWDIIWSRIGMHGVSVPFFELLSVGFMLRALRTQNLMDYTLAGFSLGFGLCFYPPLRLFPAVVCIFLLFLWFYRHDLFLSCWRGFLFLGLGIFIASAPVSQYAIRQPDVFFGRMQNVSIFKGKSAQEGWKAAAKTTGEHLLMFNYQGDRNGRHNIPGEPMLDPISGALLVLGVGLSLWRIRRPGSFLLIAWLLIMLVPAIFSLDFESPQSYRAIGSLPAVFLLSIVPIHALWQEWDQTSLKRPAAVFILPLVLVLAGVGYINYHNYFDRQAKDSDSWGAFSTPETIIGKTMIELGPQVDYYVSVFFYNAPTIQFLAPNITESHSLQTYDTLPVPTDGKRTMVFFVDSDRKPFFLQAQHYYPHADFKEHKSPSGVVVLYQITLKPSDILASQGITASYYRNANWSEQPFLVRNETSIDADWKDGDPSQFPFGVKWQGVLYAEHFGLYHFTLHSPAPSELYMDNVKVALVGEGVQTAEIELAKGCHDLVIKTLGKEGHFELDWQPPNGQQTPIPFSDLFLPPISNNGLLGKYFPNGDWQGPPAFTQVDPWIHFNYHNQPLQRPYTVEWAGRINITKAGHYRFGLESIDESALFIDDAQIIGDIKANEYQEGEVDLSSGFHSLRLRYADRTGYTHINLYWTPPNSEQESIPQEVLFLP